MNTLDYPCIYTILLEHKHKLKNSIMIDKFVYEKIMKQYINDTKPKPLCGATGICGPTGITGCAGPRGAIGPREVAGPRGATGPGVVAGPTGITGCAGPRGITGGTGF